MNLSMFPLNCEENYLCKRMSFAPTRASMTYIYMLSHYKDFRVEQYEENLKELFHELVHGNFTELVL